MSVLDDILLMICVGIMILPLVILFVLGLKAGIEAFIEEFKL